jgi:hypothetical protein
MTRARRARMRRSCPLQRNTVFPLQHALSGLHGFLLPLRTV